MEYHFLFACHANDWELGEFIDFSVTICKFSLVQGKHDKVSWKGCPHDIFSVWCFFSTRMIGVFVLVGVLHGGVLFGSLVPRRHAFFTWEAIWGKILTMDQLQQCGLPLASSCLCKSTREKIDHLLLYCY